MTTFSMMDDCTHYFLDFDGNILNQYSPSGGCPLSVPNDITSNDFILPVYENDTEDNYFFLKFLHFKNDSVNEIPRFKLNEQLYVTVPEKIFKLQNGDYLYFASNREIFEGRVRGKFMTTYRFAHNSLFKEFPKIKETQLFTLYPNPINSGDLLYLYFNNVSSGTIEIYNMSGQQVLKEIMVDQKLKAIQIEALDAGVYNIVFYNGNNIHTEQLIVL